MNESRLDRAVQLLDEIKQVTIWLADAVRAAQLEEALDGLWSAAFAYTAVVELTAGGGDPLEITLKRLKGDELFGSARRRLERMGYVAAASVLAYFDEFIQHPLEAAQDALASGSSPESDLQRPYAGRKTLEQALLDAP